MRFTEIGQQLRAYQVGIRDCGPRKSPRASGSPVRRFIPIRKRRGDQTRHGQAPWPSCSRSPPSHCSGSASNIITGRSATSNGCARRRRRRSRSSTCSGHGLLPHDLRRVRRRSSPKPMRRSMEQSGGDKAPVQLAALEQVQGIMASRKRMYAMRQARASSRSCRWRNDAAFPGHWRCGNAWPLSDAAAPALPPGRRVRRSRTSPP